MNYLEGKLNGTPSLDDLLKRIEECERIVFDDRATVEQLSNSFNELNLLVTTYNRRIQTNTDDIVSLNLLVNNNYNELNRRIQSLNEELNRRFESLARVAYTGSYLDLIDKPFIPSKVSDLNNDNNYVSGSITNDNITIDNNSVSYGETGANKLLLIGSDGKIDMSVIPDSIVGKLIYGGTFNASTKIATLTNTAKTQLGTQEDTITFTNDDDPITGPQANEGIYYINNYRSLEPVQFFNLELSIGDWLISNGDTWDKIESIDSVTSVNGRVGDVVVKEATGKLDIKVNNTTLVSFDSNSNSTATVNITVPTTTEELENNSNFVKENELEDVAFSGNYNDLKNKPVLPTKVSDLTNDSDFISENEVDEKLSEYSKTEDYSTVAFSGDYEDLKNKPVIPGLPDLATVAVTGDYDDLLNKPIIPVVDYPVTDVQIEGQSIVDEHGVANITMPTFVQVQSDWNQDDTESVDYIKNKPEIPEVPITGIQVDGNTITPVQGIVNITIPTVPISEVQVNSTTITPVNGVVNVEVPTNVSDLNNDSGYITGIDSNDVISALGYTPGTSNFSGDYNDLNNKPNLATVATSGSYNDLTDLPTIPTVPITTIEVNGTTITPTSGVIDIPVPSVPIESISVNGTTLTPTSGGVDITIPTIPTNVSAFTNDAQYVTETRLAEALTPYALIVNCVGYEIEEVEE